MHLGVIPDGNRRYAQEHGIKKYRAYRRAKNVILDIFDDIDDLPVKIDEATFYLLSEENLNRDDNELENLFQLLEDHTEELAKRFGDQDFKFNWATTRPDAIPDHLREKLEGLEERFDSGERQLNALIAYSGKSDILQASEAVAANGGEFDNSKLAEHLQVNTDIDYVIRTGDNPYRECLSGFPIWNSSYAEFYHIKKNFPAVTREDIDEALEHLNELRRAKGK